MDEEAWTFVSKPCVSDFGYGPLRRPVCQMAIRFAAGRHQDAPNMGALRQGCKNACGQETPVARTPVGKVRHRLFDEFADLPTTDFGVA